MSFRINYPPSAIYQLGAEKSGGLIGSGLPASVDVGARVRFLHSETRQTVQRDGGINRPLRRLRVLAALYHPGRLGRQGQRADKKGQQREEFIHNENCFRPAIR